MLRGLRLSPNGAGEHSSHCSLFPSSPSLIRLPFSSSPSLLFFPSPSHITLPFSSSPPHLFSISPSHSHSLSNSSTSSFSITLIRLRNCESYNLTVLSHLMSAFPCLLHKELPCLNCAVCCISSICPGSCTSTFTILFGDLDLLFFTAAEIR